MNETEQNYNECKCLVCGQTIRFYNIEYKKPCKNCGTWVFETRNYAQQKKHNKTAPKCWVCLDRGIIEYPVQCPIGVYTFVARCTCPAGLKWPPSIPLLEQCENAPKSKFLELKNRNLLGKPLALVKEDVPKGFIPVENTDKLPF